MSSLHQAESTISGKAAVVRRYLSYLHLQGRDTPSDWSIRDLKQFILETIDEYNSKSHLLSALRDFHAYLSKCGAVDFAYETAMMCPSTPRKKVLPCFTEEELSQIFYSIDTSSAVGKRDYAMLMLAVKTGLRIYAFLPYADTEMKREAIQKATAPLNPLKTPLSYNAPMGPDLIRSLYGLK